MLETNLMTLASLLASPAAAAAAAIIIAPTPPRTHPVPKGVVHDESTPNITAITCVPQAAFESYVQGGLVRSHTTINTNTIHTINNTTTTTAIATSGDDDDATPTAAAATTNRRWTCSVSPSFT